MTVNIQHAQMILRKAVEMGKQFDIPFKTKGEAESFRFMIYKARRRFRKDGAKANEIPLDQFTSMYDSLHFGIAPMEDGRVALRVTPVRMDSLEILDPATGERLDPNAISSGSMPTLEELMKGEGP